MRIARVVVEGAAGYAVLEREDGTFLDGPLTLPGFGATVRPTGHRLPLSAARLLAPVQPRTVPQAAERQRRHRPHALSGEEQVGDERHTRALMANEGTSEPSIARADAAGRSAPPPGVPEIPAGPDGGPPASTRFGSALLMPEGWRRRRPPHGPSLE